MSVPEAQNHHGSGRFIYRIKDLEAANDKRGKVGRLISTPASTVAVAVIPTNEELMIARGTLRSAMRASA